ncbi:hypothetical protein B0T19DRAFT_126793 [Cercophora scortea]|uniref:Glycine-rich cell wall structural protein 1 n=1 Tax=Cercophora scortea TaxID=314031 RepID=A0AAE0MI44_9PEZI|nr:hypothetical protein B0T19DRAFT_126793 [Cercophora scortea]
METINNLAASAAKAVWGPSDAHVEPVSGKSGDVSKGEPYDAGNIEHVEDVQTTTTTTAPKVDTFDDPTTKNVEAADVAPLTDEPEVKEQRNVQQQTEKETQRETQRETKPEGPKLGPAETQGSSDMAGDSTTMQNDVRDPSNPDTHSKNTAQKENVDDTDGLDTGDNPNKLEGPGPRPLAEIAKENGGDVGNASKSSSDAIGPDESGGGSAGQDSDGPQKQSHGEGTGEQWVKSSGLTADGGDFDASAPGAGREADRLLETKGVHREGPNTGLSGNGVGHDVDDKHKVSLKDKIKAKLHKNHAS